MVQALLLERHGVNEIVPAIRGIKPGEEVTFFTSDGGRPIGLEDPTEEGIAQKAALSVAEKGKGMIFHRRAGRLWHHVVRGVEPNALRIIEAYYSAVPLPEIPRRHP